MDEVQSKPAELRRGDTFELLALAACLGESHTGLAACVDDGSRRWNESPSAMLLRQFTDTIGPTFIVGDTVIYGLQSMARLRAVETARAAEIKR